MIQIYGVRHHGPGCARSLLGALEDWQPDAVVIEAPAEVEPILVQAADAGMVPPVAMLIYPQAEPSRSVVYPMVTFSPEWQAVQWTVRNKRVLRAMDLPMSHRMALDQLPAQQSPNDEPLEEKASPPSWRVDPLAVLAQTAGYTEHELWWEEQIERRHDTRGVFVAIQEAMQAIRSEFPETNESDLLREAFMRKTIRSVVKEGHQKIAVVCGAWHGPVLDEPAIAGKRPGCLIREDAARLKGLPRIKTVATWIPWSFSRMAYRSGYGAGVHSPGWYAHLWESHDAAPTRWVVNAARLLRERDLSASSASVIETMRLADALAALRDRRSPGLQELNEAILTVLCQGESGPLELIRKELEVGDRLGAVPADVKSVPLAEDVTRLQKSLRLKPSPYPRLYDFDLRNEHPRAQSRMLHRLRILGIPWGILQESGSRWSTFHEIWNVKWEPEFAISLIEANIWGNTLESASTSRLRHLAQQATQLAAITSLLDQAIDADLFSLIPALMEQIQSVSAVTTDVLALMHSLPPLARIVRYGNVRGTETAALDPVIESIVIRLCISLPVACAGVDDEMAGQLVDGLALLQQGLEPLQRDELDDQFQNRIRDLADSEVHGLIRGWSVRYLLEKNLLDAGALELLARQALSPANETPRTSAWITGLLKGNGLQLFHQEILWRVMDHWMKDLPEETFVEMLPILRRGFSSFSHAERRQMGEIIKRLDQMEHPQRTGDNSGKGDDRTDPTRASRVMPVLALILDVEVPHE